MASVGMHKNEQPILMFVRLLTSEARRGTKEFVS